MTITRRTFISLAGATAIGVKASYVRPLTPVMPNVAYMAAKGSPAGLYAFACREPEWRLLEFIPAEEPVALIIHPDCRTLYILHDVDTYRNLPRAYVSAYRLDALSPKATMLGVQPLSLSATSPRHFAISPDGKFLIASAQGGGIYNLFPIFEDGSIGRACGIRKEVGCGVGVHSQHSAQPRTALFTERGDCILTIDQGTDRMSILEANPSLRVRAHCALPPGTGAHSLVIHRASQLAFVSGALSQALLALRIDVSAAAISEPVTLIADGVTGPLALHPSLDILYAATSRGVAVYDFHHADEIRRVQHLDIQHGKLESQSLAFSPSLEALFVPSTKGLFRMPVERSSGLLHAPRLISSVPHAQSVAFL